MSAAAESYKSSPRLICCELPALQIAKALRYHALTAKRAGLLVDDDPVDLEMPIERDARLSAPQKPFESGFTNLDRLAPKIFTIKGK